MGYRCLEGGCCGGVEGLVRWGWMGVVRVSGRAYGGGGKDLGSRGDVCFFIPQFSTESHLLGENKVIRNPLQYIVFYNPNIFYVLTNLLH